MDYKEKYEQALERARQFSEKPYLEDSAGIVEYIFPELKGSEDEKIRKEIISFLKNQPGQTIPTSQYDSWLCWLENQGEKKPDSLETTARLLLDESSKSPYNNKPITDAQTIIKELLNFLKDSTSYNPNALNEQKPTEWSEEDEEIRNAIMEAVTTLSQSPLRDRMLAWLEKRGGQKVWSKDERIKTFIRGLLLPHIADSHIEGDKIVHNKDIDNYRKALAWLERQGKHKPAEWSEEDEQHIDSLLKRLEGLCRNEFERTRFAISEDIDWLKSLKNIVQPQPQPVWSEEDEFELECILSHLKNYLHEDAYIGYKNWLKSLRPQNTWKPSDEQMVVLNDIIINGHLSNANERILKGLQEQLKKLR